MSKTVTLLIAVLIVIGSYIVIHDVNDSKKTSPFEEKNYTKSAANFQDWKEFDQADGTFNALFPVLPQHVTDKIEDPITGEPRKYDMYAAADENGTGFMVITITFPDKVDEKNIDKILRSAVDDVLKRNKENKLKMTKAGRFHDSNALDFALENKEVSVAGKAILHNKTLYVLSMADKPSDFNAEELNFFVNSFHIKEENKSVKEVAPGITPKH